VGKLYGPTLLGLDPFPDRVGIAER
jgi:hypothetical protein